MPPSKTMTTIRLTATTRIAFAYFFMGRIGASIRTNRRRSEQRVDQRRDDAALREHQQPADRHHDHEDRYEPVLLARGDESCEFTEKRHKPWSLAAPSIGIERVAIIANESRILAVLIQNAVADDQHLDLGSHQAAEGVLGRAGDRLAAHV